MTLRTDLEASLELETLRAALSSTLDVIDELYRKYDVWLDAADIAIVRAAREALSAKT